MNTTTIVLLNVIVSDLSISWWLLLLLVGRFIKFLIARYRQEVNPHVLIVSVNMKAKGGVLSLPNLPSANPATVVQSAAPKQSAPQDDESSAYVTFFIFFIVLR